MNDRDRKQHQRLSLVCRMAGNIAGPLLDCVVAELALTTDHELFAERFRELPPVVVGFALALISEAERQLSEGEPDE